jgi:geranylgeranyl pyrophosphate synthase
MSKNDFQKTDKNYIILGVEKKKAKFFVIKQGAVMDVIEMIEKKMPNVTHGSYPTGIAHPRVDKVERHVEKHIEGFMKKVAKKTGSLSKKYPRYFFILAGRKEVFPKLQKELSNVVNNKIKAEFKVDLDMPDNKILLKARNKFEN